MGLGVKRRKRCVRLQRQMSAQVEVRVAGIDRGELSVRLVKPRTWTHPAMTLCPDIKPHPNFELSPGLRPCSTYPQFQLHGAPRRPGDCLLRYANARGCFARRSAIAGAIATAGAGLRAVAAAAGTSGRALQASTAKSGLSRAEEAQPLLGISNCSMRARDCDINRDNGG